jgi:hypothetical protein
MVFAALAWTPAGGPVRRRSHTAHRNRPPATSASNDLSFFDEDEEPTRRTPRPRRAAPPRAGGADSQTLLVRRALGLGGLLLLILILVLGIRSCTSSQHKNALQDYNREIGAIISDSDKQVAGPFFELLGTEGESAQDIENQISSLRATAEQHLEQARELDPPDEMLNAQESALIALELRQDGVAGVGQRIGTALGDEGEEADKAFAEIAGQMQAFLSSDVLWQTRVVPSIKSALDDAEIGGQNVAATEGSLPDLAWLDEGTVATRLGKSLSSGGSGSDEEPAPGTHGTGLVSVSAGDVTLQPGTSNRIPRSTDAFTIRFENQGENDEVDVNVVMRIARADGGGNDIRVEETVDQVARQQTAEVSLPLETAPAAETAMTITVEVKPVPGEKITENNKQEYPAIFVEG